MNKEGCHSLEVGNLNMLSKEVKRADNGGRCAILPFLR